jgi:hypothetical protein
MFFLRKTITPYLSLCELCVYNQSVYFEWLASKDIFLYDVKMKLKRSTYFVF